MTSTYTCEACGVRWTDRDGEVCPGCRRARKPIEEAARRLITEIDRTQRAGRTLVGFPTELLAHVEELRAALGGEP